MHSVYVTQLQRLRLTFGKMLRNLGGITQIVIFICVTMSSKWSI